MTEQEKLKRLATRLQVLRSEEKNKYFYELDEYAKDCQVREKYKQSLDAFFPHRLASQIYYSLEGRPYTQPEFASQVTRKDVLAREKFNVLYAGITAYVKASDEEKKSFKERALMMTSLCEKVGYFIRTRRNELA